MQRPDETCHRPLEWTAGSALAEQLAAQIVLDQKFTDYQPGHPQGGPDGGKDALCKKGRKRWVVAGYFHLGQRRFCALWGNLDPADLPGRIFARAAMTITAISAITQQPQPTKARQQE